MGNYNPRQNTMMRFKDARELEKFKFFTGNYDFDNEVLESASTDPLYKPLIDLIMESNNKTKQFGIIVNDSPAAQYVYVGTINGYVIDIYALGTNIIFNVNMTYRPDTDTLTINYTEENLISEDNVKTIFGQDITGTGNIELYRHQITIYFDTDNKEAHYVVYSSSKKQITDYKGFIEVAKPISNFNYPAIYVNGDNVEPAFIRFASGTILVGLSTGTEPYNGVSDNVNPI